MIRRVLVYQGDAIARVFYGPITWEVREGQEGDVLVIRNAGIEIFSFPHGTWSAVSRDTVPAP